MHGIFGDSRRKERYYDNTNRKPYENTVATAGCHIRSVSEESPVLCFHCTALARREKSTFGAIDKSQPPAGADNRRTNKRHSPYSKSNGDMQKQNSPLQIRLNLNRHHMPCRPIGQLFILYKYLSPVGTVQ